jgi:hypothetical protein
VARLFGELSLARKFAPAKNEEWCSAFDSLISPEHRDPRIRQFGVTVPWLSFGKCVVVVEGFHENMNLYYMNFSAIVQTEVVVPCVRKSRLVTQMLYWLALSG